MKHFRVLLVQAVLVSGATAALLRRRALSEAVRSLVSNQVDFNQRHQVFVLGSHHGRNGSTPDMTPEEIEGAYDETKDLLRDRSNDYVRIDSAMRHTSGEMTKNITALNTTIERNIEDLSGAVEVAADQYKTVQRDIVRQAHANYSDSLLTAHGADRHSMTPEMQKVMQLEDELGHLKRQADGIFNDWVVSDVTHTPTVPPTSGVVPTADGN